MRTSNFYLVPYISLELQKKNILSKLEVPFTNSMEHIKITDDNTAKAKEKEKKKSNLTVMDLINQKSGIDEIM